MTDGGHGLRHMESGATPINLVVLGPPGAGKGTQALEFAQRHEIPAISTGNILRDAVRSGSELGQLAKTVMDAGGLVDDQLMVAIVRERLTQPDVRKGFVLDGFPRTVAQATALDEMMVGQAPLIVVDIMVPDDALVARLACRRVCGQCGNATSVDAAGVEGRCDKCGGDLVLRSDDAESTVRARLRVYAEATRPLVDYYSSRPTFRAVDGNMPPTVVGTALTRVVGDMLAALPTAGSVSEGTAG